MLSVVIEANIEIVLVTGMQGDPLLDALEEGVSS